MTVVLTIIHVIVCFFLVVVVLLQSGKAADLAGAFGGMGSQTAFGPRGSATVLSKATTLAAAVFMLTSLSLAILATRHAGGTGSVLERQKAPATTSAPATPGTPGTPAAPAPSGQAPITFPAQSNGISVTEHVIPPAPVGKQTTAPAPQPAPAKK